MSFNPRNLSVHSLTHRILLALAGIVIVGAVYGQPEQPARQALELRVKAGFLFTFAKYVEWPAAAFKSSTNALVIGVLGTDPFGNTLDAVVAGKAIDDRPIQVQRFQRVEDVLLCHVLFVGASEKDRLLDIQKQLGERPVLTVSDLEGFLEHGGHIQFVAEEDRVKFDINFAATKRAGLNLDANLLRVARRVIGRTGQKEGD